VSGSEAFWAQDGRGVFGYHKGGEIIENLLRTQQRGIPTWPIYDTNFKMNPPLRSARDRDAILGGLADGTIDVICSDHAPHVDYEKEVEFDYAPFGITGLETELALSLMQLHHTSRMSLRDLLAKFTVGPAQILRLPKGSLRVGTDADVTVIDPDRPWVFRRDGSASKSKNSPFDGWSLKGKAVLTVVAGNIVWREAEVSSMVGANPI
jgi:dihydroorotase